MEFRTKIEAINFPSKVSINSKILTLGSCFTNEIFNYLSKYKIDIISNPFGTLFNPISIFKNIENSLSKSPINEFKIIQNASIYHHYDFHSQLGAISQKELENEILKAQNITSNYIQTGNFLFITLGTAWVHELKQTNEIVANCHKQPSELFSKRLLEVEEITKIFFDLKKKVEKINPELEFVFTVSPVRHTREGLFQNNISKATLHLAINKMCENDSDIIYFPSYEIVMDDLRDYRFFGTDLIHPNSQAIDYVFEYFTKNFADEDLQKHMNSWEKIHKMLHHKPFNEGTEDHKSFLNKLLSKLENYPYPVDLSQEILATKEKIAIS